MNSTYYKIYKIIILSVTLFFPQFITGQELVEKRSFTLKEAQNFALENNLNIKNAKLDIEHAQNVIWGNTATGLPQLNSQVVYNNNLSLQTSLIPAEIFGGPPGEMIEVQFGTQHNANASISASQIIFDGPYIVGLQAAKIFRKASQQNLEKTETDTKELIAQNYYLALLAERTYVIIDSNYKNILKTISETQKMYEKGFVEELDVDNLKVSAISLENAMKSAERQIEVAYRMLKYQLGIDLDIDIELSEKLEEIIGEIDISKSLIDPFSVINHIDYKLLQTQEQLAYMNLRRQKAEYFPTINASYLSQWSAMRNKFNFLNPEENWYYSSMLGFTLSVPIFSSGNKKAMVSEKRIEYEKASNAKKLMEDGLILQNQQIRSDFNTAYEKYLGEKENIKIASKVLQKTRVKVREGMASSLDFTQVNDQYLQIESNYISAMVELLNAKLRLDKAMNRL